MPRSSGTSSNPQTVPRRISAPAATSGSLVSNCYCFALFYNPGKNTIDIASTDRERESSHAQQEQDHERRQIAAKAPRRQEKIKNNHKQTHTPTSSQFLCPSRSRVSVCICHLHHLSPLFVQSQHSSRATTACRISAGTGSCCLSPLQHGQTAKQ